MLVLMIDDDPDVLLLCRVNLEHAGHKVLEASDGDRGMELALTRQPDLIVLDVTLPRIDGLSVLRELRIRPDTAEIPVILLTARAQRTERVLGWEAGCVGYVTKPFLPDDLVVLVAEIHALSPGERRLRRVQALAGLQGAS